MELIHRADSSFITLDDEALSQEIEEIQRYSLGNQLRTGFFGQDASVQTDVSELPLVKHLSEETTELVKRMEALKEDAASKVKLVEAHYETRLQQEAEDFYTSINYKVKALENHYEEKITVLRNSYRQQLSDAIEVIKASYKNKCMKNGDVVMAVPADKARVQDLLNELQEKESKIVSLREQLKEYEKQALLENSSEPADDPEKAWLRTENAKLNDIVDALHVEMEQMQHTLEAKDQKLEDLALDVSQLKSKAEDDTKALQKVFSENEKLKVQLDAEKEEGRKQMAQLQQEMEKEIESIKMSQSQKEKLAAERLAEQERHGAQEAKLNAQKAQRAAAQVELDSKDRILAEELEKLRNEEKSQKQHIDRLQKQIAMINRAWEKKFEILQKSFHAIKDEMFLRQSLQRQAAVLHQASVRYTMDALVTHQGQNPAEASLKTANFPTKTPLPSIGTTEPIKRKTVDIHVPCGQIEASSTTA